MLPFTVRDYKAIHVPQQSDRIKFSKFSNFKDWSRIAKWDDLRNTNVCSDILMQRGENCSLKSKAFLQEVPDSRGGAPRENSPETRVILVEK